MVARSAPKDPRHPDTTADAGVTPEKLDPEAYGFTTIEETSPAPGPGSVGATVVEPISSVPNSTFASRSKVIQRAETKTADSV